MKIKLIQTKDYLLLINEEAETKPNKYALNIASKEVYKTSYSYRNLDKITGARPVIAYYPLSKEAKELDLPRLPDPFEEDKYIKDLAQQKWGNVHRTGVLGFIEGYKAAQPKQFSAEDIKKAFEEGGKHRYVCEANGKDKKCYCRNDNECNFASYITSEEYIQSLSTQQLPKEFIPEFDIVHTDHAPNGFEKVLKFKANSEGKQELVGEYKY